MHVDQIDPLEHRDADHDVDDLFVNRWSPRAMSGEPVSEEELMRLFEAARWAPSSYNNQPWRFVYACRDTPAFDRFFDLLVDFNQGWCKNAGALVVVVSKTTFDHNGKPATTHTFDTGAAWMALALQGSQAGLVVHGMQGFDAERAAEVVAVPEDHVVEIMIAIGQPGDEAKGPKAARGETPNDRRPLEEIVFRGSFADRDGQGD